MQYYTKYPAYAVQANSDPLLQSPTWGFNYMSISGTHKLPSQLCGVPCVLLKQKVQILQSLH